MDVQPNRDLQQPGNAASVTITIATPTWLLRGLSMLMAPAMVIIMGIDLRIRGQERLLIHGIPLTFSSRRDMLTTHSSHPATVLFADDDGVGRSALSRLLRHQGFHVWEAGTADECRNTA